MFTQKIIEFQGMNVHKFLKLMPKSMRKQMILQMKDILEREYNAVADTAKSDDDPESTDIPEKEHTEQSIGLEGIPEKVQQQMDEIMQGLIKSINDPKALNEARQVRQQQLLQQIKNDIQTNNQKEWYEYVFPYIGTDIKEIIAWSCPIHYDTDMLQLALLTSETFCFIVYIDQNNRIQCKERGDIRTLPLYNAERDHEAYAMINKALTYPTDILWETDTLMFLRKLGLAHGMRYECGYEQIPALVNDATHFAQMRNMCTTRDMVLYFATMVLIIIVAFFMGGYSLLYVKAPHDIRNNLITFQLQFASTMGVVGAYISLWFRYRTLEEVTYGNRSSIFWYTISRFAIAVSSACVAILLVKNGLILSTFSGTLEVIGLAGFIAGFSERFIPSFFHNNISPKSETNINTTK